MTSRKPKKCTRRDFLRWSAIAGMGMVAAQCGPAPTPETIERIITKEVEVEKIVTKEVEKIVTPTPEPTPAPITDPIYGGIFKFAVAEDIGNLDPAILTTTSSGLVSYQIRNMLARIDPQGNLVPDLAESWEHEQGKKWIFHLRRGVLWHSGREFIADDVIYTFNRVLDPDVGSPGRAVFEAVKQIGKDDDYTVIFELDGPNPDFVYNFNSYQAKLVPFDQSAEEHNTRPIGTGPFVLQEIVPGERVILTRNENYFREDLPYLDEVHVFVMPDASARIAGLQSGAIDAVQEVGFDNFQLLELDPRLVPAPSLPVVQQVIYMDLNQPPFDDKRVRDAMRYIADREGLLNAAYYGQGIISCDTPLPPGNPYRKDVGVCEQDIEKAKQLLADAGHPDGLDIELWTLSDRPGYLAVALAFQEQAKAANVNVEVRTVPGKIFWSEKWLTVSMGVSNWGPRPSADAQFRLGYLCDGDWNETKFCDEEFEKLLDEALVETDEAKRQELYTRAQEILATEGGTIIAFYYPRLAACRAGVMNFVGSPTNEQDLTEVWLSSEA